MPAQTQTLTERQLELLTKAAQESDGFIEPHLHLKGGVKVRMIDFFAARGLIIQVDGRWRITPAALAIVENGGVDGHVPPEIVDALPEAYVIPTFLEETNAPALADDPQDDPEIEAAVTAAEAAWQAGRQAVALRLLKVGVEGSPKQRPDSKQAQVIEMLKRSEGATIAQIGEITGWQSHTTRGFFAGTVKKKLGLTITSHKPPQGERVYRVEVAAA